MLFLEQVSMRAKQDEERMKSEREIEKERETRCPPAWKNVVKGRSREVAPVFASLFAFLVPLRGVRRISTSRVISVVIHHFRSYTLLLPLLHLLLVQTLHSNRLCVRHSWYVDQHGAADMQIRTHGDTASRPVYFICS